MSTVAIHQPSYLPWIWFFARMAQSDTFVLLDNVQFEKNYFDNRNKIKTAQGWIWLTVPVQYDFGQKLNGVLIDAKQEWEKKHQKSIFLNYKKALYFSEYFPFFEKTYNQKWEKLIDLNIVFIDYLAKKLGIETEIVLASDLDVRGEKDERLLNICKKLKADTYLSGRFGRKYLDEQKFKDNGIKVVYQEVKDLVYPQLHGEFVPDLSVVDLIFNCGPESLNIMLGKKA